MTGTNDRYSLWVMPKGGVGTRLQQLIAKLAAHYNAPAFNPHITLVANTGAAGEELGGLKQKVEGLARQINKFTITLTEYGYMDEEHRCLYLLAKSAQFPLVYETAAQVFPQVNDEHFQAMPHLSVLYGHYSEETKQQIMRENPWSAAEFTVDSLELCLSTGSADQWRVIFSTPLGG